MTIQYEKYAELVSRIINRVASDKEREQVKSFEDAQPDKCPYCGAPVRSQFAPVRVVHDIKDCPRRSKPAA